MIGAEVAAGLAVALLCLLLGAWAIRAGARLPFRWVALGGAAVALLQAAWRAWRALRRGAWDDAGAARTVGAGLPAIHSDLLSSVELSRDREALAGSGGYSAALIDAHVERTAARARALDLAQVIPDRPARRAGAALLAVVVVHGVALLSGGAPLAHAYRRVVAGDPPGAPPPQLDPITGDIQLTYRYPAYMRRDAKTVAGTGGEIRAPRGTEVILETRADREVAAAELLMEGQPEQAMPAAKADEKPAAAPAAPAHAPAVKRWALAVKDGRDLSGRLVVEDGGSYRFRFLDRKGRELALGAPLPIVVEPDAFPTAQLTAPEREVEVDAGATVNVGWSAEDDVGLDEVALVLTLPGGKEDRRVLRSGDPVRRDGGDLPLPLGPLKLAEGEELTYRLEARDGDTVSGPKTGSSDTHVIRVYSEAEHRRRILEKATAAFEELVALLGDRLDLFAQGSVATADRLPLATALDGRARGLHEKLRQAAQEIRADRAGPPEVAAALQNVATSLRVAEQRVSATRAQVAQAFRIRVLPDRSVVRTMGWFDAQLDRELEKGILYLEQLLDKRRAEDLVRLARDLNARRKELAGLLDRYRQAPTEARKQELVAQVQRMKERVRDLLQRMAELSKGFNDEHMNQEALAELAKSQDLMSGLDDIEKKLAAGDVEGAMKALDQMAGAMDQMMAGLQRTAGRPDEKAQALRQELMAFQEALERVQKDQAATAAETGKIRAAYRKRAAEQMKNLEADLKKLSQLATEARKDVEATAPAVTPRTQPEYEGSRDALQDVEKALSMRELEGAREAVEKADPPVRGLTLQLDQDALMGSRSLGGPGEEVAGEAARRAHGASGKVAELRKKLDQLFPDPRGVLSKDEQKRLGELGEQQARLEKDAARLQEQLGKLAQEAPIFPPSAQEQLGQGRGHMGEAAAELGARNPQRGHGHQQLAMDALERVRKGLEDAARKGGQGGGQGFPFPFAESGDQDGQGDGLQASREKVKIPGAEAHKVPEAFRKDLMEAMKQGAPERYRQDVQRYYEELVK
ncbi:MAG: hypothetical protein QM767_21535 [Anaeromyxobacter sp.]